MRWRATVSGGIAVAAICVVGVGCLRYTRAEGPDVGRFDLLYQRDLSAFEQSIAIEKHVGSEDAWTRVGEAWLALANCEPVDARAFDEETEDAPVAAFVHATLAFEDVRRRTRVALQMTGRRRTDNALLTARMKKANFFDRSPAEPPDDMIAWPAEPEAWADEVPAMVSVDEKCDTLPEQVRRGRGVVHMRPGEQKKTAGGTREQANGDGAGRVVDYAARQRSWSLSGWRAELLASLDRVLNRYDALPETQQSGKLEGLYWRTHMYGAATAFRLGRVYEATSVSGELPDAVLARLGPKALRERTVELLEPIIEPGSAAADDLDDSALARAHLLGAWIAERDGRPDDALVELDLTGPDSLAVGNRWSARYLRLRILTRLGRWEAAAKLADKVPPRTSRYYAAYAYRIGLALRRTDKEDRFLGVAKSVFRDRSPTSDPFLRALYSEVLKLIASYPFEDRVVELLEEMGPRSNIYSRVEQLARVALNRGYPENAAAAAHWLMGHHHDARYEPRYRAILALVAFQNDRPDRFRQELEQIAHRPEKLLEAIPTRRRATFFAPADAALARIMRQTLPMMAEWGDSQPARERRREWLEVIVEETQQFLRDTEESIARQSLVELYRLASALLEEHPRGYAERVGEKEPAPLVLGTVRVGAGQLQDHEPSITIAFPEPYSLTVIPRAEIEPKNWEYRWPQDDDRQEEGTDA